MADLSQDRVVSNNQKLYNNLLKSGKVTQDEIGDFNTFNTLLSDSSNASKLRDNLISKKNFSDAELGSNDDFLQNLDPLEGTTNKPEKTDLEYQQDWVRKHPKLNALFQKEGMGLLNDAYIGTKKMIGSFGTTIDVMAENLGNNLTGGYQTNEKGEVIAPWEKEYKQPGKSDFAKKIEQFEKEVPASKGGFTAFFGQMLPQVTGLIATTLLRNKSVSEAYLASMYGTSFGSGIENYDKHIKETGETPNANDRNLVGIGYGAAEYLGEKVGLDYFMPKGYGKLTSGAINPIAAKEIGKNVIENYAKLTKQSAPMILKKIIAGSQIEGGQEVATEGIDIIIDKWVTGEDVTGEDVKSRLFDAYKGGVFMSAGVMPFAHISQNVSTTQRRRQQGEVTIGIDEKGLPLEIIKTENGIIGIRPNGDEIGNISEQTIKNSATFKTEDFEKTMSSLKKGSDVLSEDWKDESIKQNLLNSQTEGQIIVNDVPKRVQAKKEFEQASASFNDIPNANYTEAVKNLLSTYTDPKEIITNFNKISSEIGVEGKEYETALKFLSSSVKVNSLNKAKQAEIQKWIDDFQDDKGNVTSAEIEGEKYYIKNSADLGQPGRIIFAKNQKGEVKPFNASLVKDWSTLTPDQITQTAQQKEAEEDNQFNASQEVSAAASQVGIEPNKSVKTPNGIAKVVSVNNDGTVTVVNQKGLQDEFSIDEVEAYKTEEQKQAEKDALIQQKESEKIQLQQQQEAEKVQAEADKLAQQQAEARQARTDIPKDKEGNPDYSQMEPEMFFEEYSKEFSEEEAKTEIKGMQLAIVEKIKKLGEKKAKATSLNDRAKIAREIKSLTAQLDNINAIVEKGRPKANEGKGNTQWIAKNSTNPDEIVSAYEQEKSNAPVNNLKEWQKFITGVKFNPDSFNRFGDKNNITSTLAKTWLNSDGHDIDQFIRDNFEDVPGFEDVTEQDVIDFITENPTGQLRKTTDTQNELRKRYREITGVSIDNHKFDNETLPTQAKLESFLTENNLNDSWFTTEDLQSLVTENKDKLNENDYNEFTDYLSRELTTKQSELDEWDFDDAESSIQTEISASKDSDSKKLSSTKEGEPIEFSQSSLLNEATPEVKSTEGDASIVDVENIEEQLAKLDNKRQELLIKVEPLVELKKKLYSNVDIESPKSEDEKQLEKQIASIFSEIQSIILEKRKIVKQKNENVSQRLSETPVNTEGATQTSETLLQKNENKQSESEPNFRVQDKSEAQQTIEYLQSIDKSKRNVIYLGKSDIIQYLEDNRHKYSRKTIDQVKNANFSAFYLRDEIFINSDKVKTKEDVDTNWIHERVHAQTKETLNNEELSLLYDQIGLREIQRIIPRIYWLETPNIQADEYISFASETLLANGKLDDKIPSDIQNIILNIVNNITSINNLTNGKNNLDNFQQGIEGRNAYVGDSDRRGTEQDRTDSEGNGVGSGTRLQPDEKGSKVTFSDQANIDLKDRHNAITSITKIGTELNIPVNVVNSSELTSDNGQTALTDNGTVTIVSDRVKSVSEVIKALVKEVAGEKGIREILANADPNSIVGKQLAKYDELSPEELQSDKLAQVIRKAFRFTSGQFSQSDLFNIINEQRERMTEGQKTNIETSETNIENDRTTVNEPKNTYKTKEGQEIQYTLTFGDDNKSTTNDLQQDENRQQNPSLRRLKEGEMASVEMKYTLDKNYIFDGRNKIESAEDIAYLFRQLENKSVENMFACLVDENQKPTIIHISMGGRAGTVIDFGVLADAVSRFSPKKVYLIHNHPSGNLVASDADIQIHTKAKDAFGEDLIGEHVIINTTSGKYASFNHKYDYDTNSRPKTVETPQNYKVLKFDKQVFKDTTEPFKVTGSKSVAKFISAQRFSSGDKLSVLILARNNDIKAYLHLPSVDFSSKESVLGLKTELQAYAGRFGGHSLILSGNTFNIKDPNESRRNIRYLKALLKSSDISLLDLVEVESDLKWVSMADEDLMEPKEGYGEARFKLIGNPRKYFPKVRGGWTKDKIIRELKEIKKSESNYGKYSLLKGIASYENAQNLRDHLFYHGTGSGISGGLYPSITMSERDAERYGGGGYGQRYFAVSVSKSKAKASMFSGMSRSVSVYPVLLNQEAKVIDRPDIQDSAELEDEIEQLWDNGVDAVRLGDWNDPSSEQELAVLNPNAISTWSESDGRMVYGSKMSDFKEKTDKELEQIIDQSKEAIIKMAQWSEENKLNLGDFPEWVDGMTSEQLAERKQSMAERKRIREEYQRLKEQQQREVSKDIRFRTEQQSSIIQNAQKYADVEQFISDYKDADFRDAHSAPSFDDTPVAQRIEDGGDFNLIEVAKGFHTQPDDYFTPRIGARYYGYDDLEGMQSYSAINNIIRAIKSGNEDQKITAYRAVPKNIVTKKLSDRDWVTFSRQYAVNHGENRFGEKEFRIIKQDVSPKDVWWDGNDINEWGYDTNKTKKLYRSDLRKIWEEANAVKFRIIGEQGATNLDKAEEATTRLDNLAIAREMEKGKSIENARLKFFDDIPDELKNDARIVNRGEDANGESMKRIQSNPRAKSAWADYIRAQEHMTEWNSLSEKEQNRRIRLATGWEKGVDGKWRYETDDSDISFDKNILEEMKNNQTLANAVHTFRNLTYRKNEDGSYDFTMVKKGATSISDIATYRNIPNSELEYIFDNNTDLISKVRNGEGQPGLIGAELDESAKELNIEFEHYVSGGTTLGSLIENKEMFKEYPQLKKVVVVFDPKSTSQGSFGKDLDGQNVITVKSLSGNQFKSTLLHEIQHAIQDIEGFAKGGNTEMLKNLSEKNKQAVNKIHEIDKELGFDDWAKNNIQLFQEGKSIDDARSIFAKTIPSGQKYIETVSKIKQIVYDNVNQAGGDKIILLSDQQYYRNLAGEVEARNVQTRMNMTPEERRNALLSETEDVAREDQIVLMDGLGVSKLELPETININGVERPTTNSKGQPIADSKNNPDIRFRVATSKQELDDFVKDSKIKETVYHGTNAEFDEFKKTNDVGFHFTPHKSVAQGMSIKYNDSTGDRENGYVKSVKINLKNPAYIPDLKNWTEREIIADIKSWNDYIDESNKNKTLKYNYDYDLSKIDNLKKYAHVVNEMKGKWEDIDGFIYMNDYERVYGKKNDSYIVLSPDQILIQPQDDIRFRIDKASEEVNTNPTDAQKEAGNYKKGHIKFDGFDISIENPKGSTRSGVDQDGNRWSNQMGADYGYIKGTVGKDKDHIDIFIGNKPELNKVYVVDQINPKTGAFDEHKVMLGFDGITEARKAYQASYPKDWKGLNNITRTTKEGLKDWFENGNTKKPFADGDVRFRMAYHGSPHQFDKFTTEKIGTGEGAQAFGWGLYFTDKKSIAEDYAKKLGQYNLKQQYQGMDVEPQSPLDSAAGIINDYQQRYNTIPRAIKRAEELKGYVDKDNPQMIKYWDGVIDWLRHSKISDFKRVPNSNLYSVELHQGKEPGEYDYLRWDKKPTDKQKEKITKQAENENIKLPLYWKNDRGINELFYANLKEQLGSAEAASKFLLRAGIDGIQYPTEVTTKGSHEESFNYVIFDENAVEVKELVRFRQSNTTKDLSSIEQLSDIAFKVSQKSANTVPENQNENTEKAMNKAHGLKGETILSKIDRWKQEVKETTQHFKYVTEKEFPQIYNDLRLFESIPEVVKKDAYDKIADIVRPIANDKNLYKAFERYVVISDLMHDIKSGIYTNTIGIKEAAELKGVSEKEIKDLIESGAIKTMPHEKGQRYQLYYDSVLPGAPKSDTYKQLPFSMKSVDEVETYYNELREYIDKNPSLRKVIANRNSIIYKVRDQLIENNLMSEKARDNTSYFHHMVMKYRENPEKSTAINQSYDVRVHPRGWQKSRTGSMEDYNTDYLQSEFEVIAQSLEQLAVKKSLQKIGQEVDIMPALVAQANNEGGSWRDFVPEGYTTWHPKPGTNAWAAASMAEKAIQSVIEGNPLTESLNEQLAEADQTLWVIPTAVANQLDEMKTPTKEKLPIRGMRFFNSTWKQWILLNPARLSKYMINNLSGDLDIVFAYNPKILQPKYAWTAAKELYNEATGKGMSKDMREAIENAVISSGLSIQEIPDVNKEGVFKTLTGDNNLFNKYWNTATSLNDFREGMLRLAAYKFFKEELNAGKTHHGVSNPKAVDALRSNEEKAGKMARELLGDYGNLSQGGVWLRSHAYPFWSWMEINAPRYYKLLRNSYQDTNSAPKTVGAAIRKTAISSTALAARIMLLSALITVWNRLFFPDEDDELTKTGNRQLRLITGRRDDGSIITLRIQGAFSDVLSFVGLEDAFQDVKDVRTGKTTAGKKVKEAGSAFVNRVGQGAMPFERLTGELITGKSVYPDILHPRPIIDRAEHAFRMVSLDKVYRFMTKKPLKKGGKELIGLVLYETDPGEAAYYAMRQRIYNFLDEKEYERPSGDPTEKSIALRYYKQAKKFKDTKLENHWLAKYKALGGTTQGMKTSIKKGEVTNALPREYKKEFLDKLDGEDREVLEMAERWYNETYKK